MNRFLRFFPIILVLICCRLNDGTATKVSSVEHEGSTTSAYDSHNSKDEFAKSYKIEAEVDALMQYGGGVNYDSTTINSAIAAIGSENTVVLVLRPGIWTLNDNLTVPSNITLKIAPGASITTTGYTLTINGPLQTGDYKVFSGSGTVAGLSYTKPSWWGGVVDSSPDAATNAIAIQAAIDCASETGHGTVDFSGGAWYVSRRVAYTYNSGTLYTILHIKPDTKYTSDGTGIIKVPDNFTSGGDYSIFSMVTDATELNNIEFNNFTIDGNGLNNLVVAPGKTEETRRRAYQIKLGQGKNIRIKNMNFLNCPGLNAINAGYHSGSNWLYDVEITGNQFSEMGSSIPGNDMPDHSTIYLQAERALISGNILKNVAAAPHGQTAIEVHGSFTTISNNIVEKYRNVANQCGNVVTSYYNTWDNNTFKNIMFTGIQIWNLFGTENLKITNNHFSGDPAGTGYTAIYQYANSGGTLHQVKNLIIQNNTISYPSIVSSSTTFGPGVQLTAINGALVQGNDFRNITGPGIELVNMSSYSLDIQDVIISGNKITDCAYYANASTPWGIYIYNNSSPAGSYPCVFKDVQVMGNEIIRKDSTISLRGINIKGGTNYGTIIRIKIYDDNTFENLSIWTWIELTQTTNFYQVYIPQYVSSIISHQDWRYSSNLLGQLLCLVITMG